MRNFCWGFFSGTLSILILSAFIICINYFPSLFSVFFNRYHEFQWSSLIILTASISMVALAVNTVLSSKLNHQKMVAENIAKSRIEWLNVTRKYVSDYISSVNKAYFYSTNVLNKNNSVQLTEFNKLLADVESKYYLVLFSVNPEEKIAQTLNDYQQIAYGGFLASQKKEASIELGRQLQVFFKKEWEKAKLEIRTGEISPSDIKHSS